MSIRLLIVDDSAFMRSIIKKNIQEIGGIEVVGIARDGLEGLEKIESLRPDVVTLDIEMPKLNGIDTLREIKKRFDTPVIMLSSLTGTEVTMECLEIGAEDFIEKPKSLDANLDDFRDELEKKLRSVCSPLARRTKEISFNLARVEPGRLRTKNINTPKRLRAIVIGASTGGPKVLGLIVRNILRELNIPIFIVQHMPKGFTSSFAKRLNDNSNIRVVEAEDGMEIENGVVYIAPGSKHMFLANGRIALNGNMNKLHGVRPAADYLFTSASEIYKDKLLGIVLTGMGKDGAMGMESIKANGGYNIIQNQETCVVYGMPRSAMERGVVDKVLAPVEIYEFINNIIRVKR